MPPPYTGEELKRYREWKATIPKDGEYGYPELSIAEYRARLKAFLQQYVDAGLKDQEEVDDKVKQFVNAAILAGGVSKDMPYVKEIFARLAPEQREKLRLQRGEEAAQVMKHPVTGETVPNVMRQRFLGQGPPEAWTPPDWQARQTEGARAGFQARETAERQAMMGQRQAWETGRETELAGLQGAEDWISRWFVEHEPSPRWGLGGDVPWTERTPESRGAALTVGRRPYMPGFGPKTFEMLQRGYTSLPAYRQAGGAEGPYPAAMPTSESEAWRVHFGVSPERWAARGEGDIEEEPEEPRLAAPPTPAWLPKLVPGLRPGEQIKPAEFPTPSGQLWGTLSPTEKQQFAGYAAWTGKPIENVMWQMGRMLPKTPRGATSKYRRPRR